MPAQFQAAFKCRTSFPSGGHLLPTRSTPEGSLKRVGSKCPPDALHRFHKTKQRLDEQAA